MLYKITPLSSSFMLASIVGFMISTKYVYQKSASFGFTFSLFFVLMFIASMISMTLAPIEAEHDIKVENFRKVKKS